MPGPEAAPWSARTAAAPFEELRSAVGLAWGLVDCGLPDQALALCDGCLQLWPDSAELQLLHRLAAIECGAAVSPQEGAALARRAPWHSLLSVMRRRLRLA